MSENNLSIQQKTSFLFDVIKRYDHYIATTNFKVGLMLSFVGAILIGLTVRVMSIEEPINEGGCTYDLAIASAILTIILSLIAAVNLLRTVFPNTKGSDNYSSLIFFADVANCEGGIDGYVKKINSTTELSIMEDLSKQTYTVAEVATEKFRLLKLATNTIICAVIPLLGITIVLLISAGTK